MLKIVSKGTYIGFVPGIVVMALPGAAAGALFALGTDRVSATAAGFGIGMALAWFGSVFVQMSIQGGGRPEYIWLAAGCGIAYAIGGAIGGVTLGCRNAFVGAAAFGIGGAINGVMTGWLAVRGGPMIVIFSGIAAAYAVGGTLLGLGIDIEGGA